MSIFTIKTDYDKRKRKQEIEIEISNGHEPTQTAEAQNTFGFSEIENVSKQENKKYANRICIVIIP